MFCLKFLPSVALILCASAVVIVQASFLPPVPPRMHKPNLNPQLMFFIREAMPEFNFEHIKLLQEKYGPELDLPLSECKDSLECHQKFVDNLRFLVRMNLTGKKRK